MTLSKKLHVVIIPLRLLSFLGICALLVLHAINVYCWQVERTATYQPYRFTFANGDSLYLGQVIQISSWSDRYLIVRDQYDGVVYFLDTIEKSARRVGREGDGPGEYRKASAFSINCDTLVVTHMGNSAASLFLLPSLEYIRLIRSASRFPRKQLWEPEGTFLSNDLPWRNGLLSKDRPDQIEDGLIGRYTGSGELIEVLGVDEFDPMKKYNSERELVKSSNRGELAFLPTGNIVFAYPRRPMMLVYTPTGRLVTERQLDMPWNQNQDYSPTWWRDGGKWMAGIYLQNITVLDSGIMISARSNRDIQYSEIGVNLQGYIALYDWDGDLKEYIHLPKRTNRDDGMLGLLMGATELNGEYWIAVRDDPAIRKLIVR